MVSYLATRGIRFPNFAYNIEIVNRERQLIDSNKGFTLPFHILEVGFHLLLYPFFSSMSTGLHQGNWLVYPGGLWCCISQTIEFEIRVIQCFNHLKVQTQWPTAGKVYFSIHQGRKPVLKNWASNLCLNYNKFTLVKSKSASGFGFLTK